MEPNETPPNPSEKPAQTGEAVVVFLDILGFRRMDSTKGFPEGQRAALSAIRNLPRRDLRPPAVRTDFYPLADAVVRVLFFESEGTRDAFRGDQMLWALEAQQELLKNGLLVQGGIAEGRVFSSPAEDMVFGPALSKAYELASEGAYFPRVAVAPSIAEDNEDFDWLKKWRDETWFIDYLLRPDVLWHGDCDVTRVPWLTETLEPHKTAVLRYVAGVRNQKELAKCAWLALYHNMNVETILWPKRVTATANEEEVRTRLDDCLIRTHELLMPKEAQGTQ
jgi:hypothetical protein